MIYPCPAFLLLRVSRVQVGYKATLWATSSSPEAKNRFAMFTCVPALLPGKDYKFLSLHFFQNTVDSGQMNITEPSSFLRLSVSLQNCVFSFSLFFAKGSKKLE